METPSAETAFEPSPGDGLPGPMMAGQRLEDMLTYRERQERKAERLREWASKRRQKAEGAYKQREHYAGDTAFWTQPGRIPQRDRLFAQMDRAHADTQKANDMQSRAAGIESAANNAIYSDDPDAIEQLEEKIVGLEGQRERIKAVNKAVRAGKLDEVPDRDRKLLDNIATHQPYHKPYERGYPSYALTNLSGNINRCKQRLAALSNPRPAVPRVILLRYAGECSQCGKQLERGTSAHYSKAESTVWCYPECVAA